VNDESVAVGLAGPDHAEGVAGLFERAGVACYCQYFAFGGDHRAWQMQCANHTALNRNALVEDLQLRRVTAFVAQVDDRVDGWLRLAPPLELQKRYDGRLYKGLPCLSGDERGRLLSVACFLVDPRARRRGVAKRLLQSAVSWARDQGASGIEAFPRGAQDVSDEEQWTGPLNLYRGEGFEVVHDFPPYPVLRLTF
jgi:GNAT superfamily N-acetyltransferase